ncbi:MAG: Rpn family recombination-promoting nuclease/putative transposase [Lachnospiraceae bacterium]|nr:Rpn family recombination-promoting nuclease/putative transposase [Lachnospiraceae bacterium]
MSKNTPITPKVITMPHDKGYKKDLSVPKEFLHFIKKYAGIQQAADWDESQVHLSDKEFIGKDYEGREADLLYEITEKGNKKIYVYILQELQSTVDYTMIFRTLIYVVDTLLRYFSMTPPTIRERKDFKLPVIIPIVFYNGEEPWTATQELKDYYQNNSGFIDEYMLNLKYYLVDLSQIDETFILDSNTVIDNIMFCDKYRQKAKLADAVKLALQRVEHLSAQDQENFENWLKNVLLTICKNQEAVVNEIMTRAKNGGNNMAFQYNIIRIFEEEKAAGREAGLIEGRVEGRTQGRAEGRAEGLQQAVLTLLSQYTLTDDDIAFISTQKDTAILTNWLKIAAKSTCLSDFIEQTHAL